MRRAALAVGLALSLALPARAETTAGGAGAGQDTLRLSLDEALARAMRDGAEMRAARAGVRIADGRVKEALAQALPQITGTLTYDRKFDSIFRAEAGDTALAGLETLFANSPFAAVHSWTADLTATQLLWSAGRVGAGMAGARAYRLSAGADRDQAQADVALAVREAYWNAEYAREVEAIAESSLVLARAQLADVTRLQGQGARSEYDLLQAQVDAANQEPPVLSARTQADVAELQLKRLLGVPLAQPLALVTPMPFADGRVPVPAPEPVDASARPSVRSADATVAARRQLLRVEQSQRWPQLTAQATIQDQAFPANGTPSLADFHRNVDASLKLEWPLFQGFRTFGTVERATAELRQAEADRDRAHEQAALDLEQARDAVREALATLAARRGTATLAQRAYHLATVRYRNGLATPLEVSDSRLRLETAQVNEVAALKDYRVALARLERAAGGPLAMTTRSYDELTPLQDSNGGR